MRTGYTAIIEDNSDVTFREFAWRCARGMGALYFMRDLPTDAPIPKRVVPHGATREALERATEALRRAMAMTLDEAAKGERDEREVARREYEAQRAKVADWDARCQRIREAATAWRPPTGDHDGLKRLMLEQLGMTTFGLHLAEPRERTPEQFRLDEVTRCAGLVKFWSDEVKREAEQCEKINAWLASLRASIGPPSAECEVMEI